MVQGDISFKDFSFFFLALVAIFSADQNHSCNFGWGYYGKYSCEITINDRSRTNGLSFRSYCLKKMFHAPQTIRTPNNLKTNHSISFKTLQLHIYHIILTFHRDLTYQFPF